MSKQSLTLKTKEVILGLKLKKWIKISKEVLFLEYLVSMDLKGHSMINYLEGNNKVIVKRWLYI